MFKMLVLIGLVALSSGGFIPLTLDLPVVGGVVISGTATPGAEVAVWHNYGNQPIVGLADDDGHYEIEYHPLRLGWQIFAFSLMSGEFIVRPVEMLLYIPLLVKR